MSNITYPDGKDFSVSFNVYLWCAMIFPFSSSQPNLQNSRDIHNTDDTPGTGTNTEKNSFRLIFQAHHNIHNNALIHLSNLRNTSRTCILND